jgi:prophage DNA circulation protein
MSPGANARAMAAPEGRDPAIDAAFATIARLSRAIEREIADYGLGDPDARRDIQRVKSQSLLELSRLAPRLSGARRNAALAKAFGDLRALLTRDLSVLGVRLLACREVAETISAAISDAQSDGTYTDSDWRR